MDCKFVSLVKDKVRISVPSEKHFFILVQVVTSSFALVTVHVNIVWLWGGKAASFLF